MSSRPRHFFSSVSRPDKVFFPPANWKSTKSYGVEHEVGPAVEHIYEVMGLSFSWGTNKVQFWVILLSVAPQFHEKTGCSNTPGPFTATTASMLAAN